MPQQNPQVLNSLAAAPQDGYSWASLATMSYLNDPAIGKIWRFLLNPSTLQFERGANYDSVDLPYTNSQPSRWKYSTGLQLSVPDLILDTWDEGKTIRPILAAIQQLMTGTPDIDPPQLIFTWGTRTINPLVLSRMRWEETAWGTNGEPKRAKVSLTLVQVSAK